MHACSLLHNAVGGLHAALHCQRVAGAQAGMYAMSCCVMSAAATWAGMCMHARRPALGRFWLS
jgi:hypothetical protein